MSVVEASKGICKAKLASLFMNDDNFSVETFTDYNERRAAMHKLGAHLKDWSARILKDVYYHYEFCYNNI
jgi:hypothetical protein